MIILNPESSLNMFILMNNFRSQLSNPIWYRGVGWDKVLTQDSNFDVFQITDKSLQQFVSINIFMTLMTSRHCLKPPLKRKMLQILTFQFLNTLVTQKC